MFTGIIENQGKLISKIQKRGHVHIKLQLRTPFSSLKLGESIAVNGVCLTVTEKRGSKIVEMDIVPETLKVTTLGDLTPGDVVNLERALRYGDAMGGHFISGHVDGVAQIKNIRKRGKNHLWILSIPKKLIPYVALKGSITLDGISLTVQKVEGNKIKIALIPHTLKETTLRTKKVGDSLNVEVDLLARYAERWVKRRKNKVKDPKFLKQLIEQGF